MKGVKNLKILAAGLCLGATLLTGCGEKITLDNSKLKLNSGKVMGSISYEELDKYVKIVTFEQNDKVENYLIVKKSEKFMIKDNGTENYIRTKYVDLKTGACMVDYLDYYDKDNSISWINGEGLNIINEENISFYFVSENFVQKEYLIEEVVTFLEEKVIPTVETKNKELVK